MATVEQFAEILHKWLTDPEHLPKALKELYDEKLGDANMQVNDMLWGATHAGRNVIAEMLGRACKEFLDLPSPGEVPDIPVVDPTKRVQIGPTLAVIDHPDKHVRIMMEEAE